MIISYIRMHNDRCKQLRFKSVFFFFAGAIFVFVPFSTIFLFTTKYMISPVPGIAFSLFIVILDLPISHHQRRFYFSYPLLASVSHYEFGAFIFLLVLNNLEHESDNQHRIEQNHTKIFQNCSFGCLNFYMKM